MFLFAVYYFAGMNKLEGEVLADFEAEFKAHDNLEKIKAFFEVFKCTAEKYDAEVDEVLRSEDYQEMAPKFKVLLDKIVANQDLESLICYCDSIDPIIGKYFFIDEIVKNEVKEACGMGEASYRVLTKFQASGVASPYEGFKYDDLEDPTKPDILGLTSFDLATIGYASVLRLKGGEELKPFIANHFNVFTSMFYYHRIGEISPRQKLSEESSALERAELLARKLDLKEFLNLLPLKRTYYRTGELYPYFRVASAYLFGIAFAYNAFMMSHVDQTDIILNKAFKPLSDLAGMILRSEFDYTFAFARNKLYHTIIGLYVSYLSGGLACFVANQAYIADRSILYILSNPRDMPVTNIGILAVIIDIFGLSNVRNSINSVLDHKYIRPPLLLLIQTCLATGTYNLAAESIVEICDMLGIQAKPLNTLACVLLAGIAFSPVIIKAFIKVDEHIYEKYAVPSHVDRITREREPEMFDAISKAIFTQEPEMDERGRL